MSFFSLRHNVPHTVTPVQPLLVLKVCFCLSNNARVKKYYLILTGMKISHLQNISVATRATQWHLCGVLSDFVNVTISVAVHLLNNRENTKLSRDNVADFHLPCTQRCVQWHVIMTNISVYRYCIDNMIWELCFHVQFCVFMDLNAALLWKKVTNQTNICLQPLNHYIDITTDYLS